MSDKPQAPDYRATMFLPATDFPMKAGLPEAEPKWLSHWAEIDLYGKLRARAKGRPLFILHDGPIYANGDIHSGTGLNHILKDFVVRSQGMLGKDAPYVPGWDCHGLPIEWKVEEKFRAEGKAKEDIAKDVLRRECRSFAAHWLNIQREQIKRLGQIGDFEHPYTTMNFKAEAVIAREAMKFVENGLLYRGFRPVMWSPVEKTALADAEVEYHEKTSPTIYVKFPLVKSSPELAHTFIVIWTTTPWTIPGNRAIAFSPDISYGLYKIADAADGSLARPSEQLLLADTLAEQVAKHAKMMLSRVRSVPADELKSLVAAHPLRSLGYSFEIPVLPAAFVTSDTGTGFVHNAPGHGEDDFELMLGMDRDYPAKNPDAFSLVQPDGSYAPHVPAFAGKRILTPEGKDGDANGAVIKELIEHGSEMLLVGRAQRLRNADVKRARIRRIHGETGELRLQRRHREPERDRIALARGRRMHEQLGHETGRRALIDDQVRLLAARDAPVQIAATLRNLQCPYRFDLHRHAAQTV